jgi:hypothetical protein
MPLPALEGKKKKENSYSALGAPIHFFGLFVCVLSNTRQQCCVPQAANSAAEERRAGAPRLYQHQKDRQSRPLPAPRQPTSPLSQKAGFPHTCKDTTHPHGHFLHPFSWDGKRLESISDKSQRVELVARHIHPAGGILNRLSHNQRLRQIWRLQRSHLLSVVCSFLLNQARLHRRSVHPCRQTRQKRRTLVAQRPPPTT